VNISETDEDIQNPINIFIYRDSSCVKQNKSDEVWSSNLGDLDVKSYSPKAHFLEEHISAHNNNPVEHYISPLCPADPAGPICTIFGTYGQTTDIIIQVKFLKLID